MGLNKPSTSSKVTELKSDMLSVLAMCCLDLFSDANSDKYGAYQRLAEKNIITWFPCYAHIRRKFFEAEGDYPEFRQRIMGYSSQKLDELLPDEWLKNQKMTL